MSKSTLSIVVPNFPASGVAPFRAVHVPCRLPDGFDFRTAISGKSIPAAAYLTGLGAPTATRVCEVEVSNAYEEGRTEAKAMMDAADSVMCDVRAELGITGPVPHGSPLPAIALAYEAECAAHDAQVKALQALPRVLQNSGLVGTHPSERETYAGGAVGMLAQYVAWVFEQACDAQTKRTEQAKP